MSYFKNIVLFKAEGDYFDVSFFEANIPLCYLSAVVKNHVNTVQMPVDMRIDQEPFRKLEEHLISMKKNGMKCDLMGISTMTASFPNAIKAARIAKKHGAYVVMGGYHSSALPEAVLQHPEVDAVIRREGELTFKEFVLKGPSNEIKGLSFKDEKGIIHHNPDREKIMDLDSLPFPDRSLRPPNPIFKKHDVIVTSRGCNGTCTFCANKAVHGRWRGRSPENVVEELEILYNNNPDLMVHIWDANFMQDPDRVAKIIELIEQKNIRLKYFCEMRVDPIVKYPHLIEGLNRIGMEWIAIGIESPNDERLRRLKKGITSSTVEKAVQILKKNNIKIIGYLMIGDPEETEQDMKGYPVYATELGIDKIMLAIQTPHPGSRLFEEMEKNGAITSYEWEKYDIGHSVARLNHMTNEQCELLMDWGWGKYYTPLWAFSRKKTMKEALYLYLSYAWIGYPGFFIHARQKENVEENLKAYISAMRGYYDLSSFSFEDSEYLDVFRGCDFQITFEFSDGNEISLLFTITDDKKFIIEIFNGRRPNVLLNYVLSTKDYINIIKSLSLQTCTLVQWGGYNFGNVKANMRVFWAFSQMVMKAMHLDTFNYRKIFRYLMLGIKFIPRKIYEVLMEEKITFNKQAKWIDKISEIGKNILYKTMFFPYVTLIPVNKSNIII
ncbi:MAG: B12-binding domain-containing radical SAM protein [Promethearchaeota archaeon]